MSTPTPFPEAEVTTEAPIVAQAPCCGAEVRLGFTSFAHVGYPRRDEPMFLRYNNHCPECGAWQTAYVEVRYSRHVEFGQGVTRRRAVGPVTWEPTFRGDRG
jgi:hypothetical protein